MRLSAALALAAVFALAGSLHAERVPIPLPRPAPKAQPASKAALCLMVEAAAQSNGLPIAYLTRVIWRESNFDPKAVGPRTRYGTRARGIAQFMPESAAESGLADPFDPVQALPKAAGLLRRLAERFGNLGLAAAAYNAGPRRLRDWLGGTGTMPAETHATCWQSPAARSTIGQSRRQAGKPAPEKKPAAKPANCETTLASLDQPPGSFAFELNRRVSVAIGKPWGVQLAGGFSRRRVLESYARAMTRLASVIAQRDPIVTRGVRAPGLAPFYQARIGADTRGAANALCARIRRAGGACLVLRNRYARR